MSTDANWLPLGTITADPSEQWYVAPGPGKPWTLPASGGFTTTFEVIDINPGFALWLSGGPDNWLRRPRMKRRAYRRRILRVTRAGRRR